MSTGFFGAHAAMQNRGRKPSKPAPPWSVRIRRARDALGWSQEILGEKLAEAGGPKGQSTVTDLETGKGDPSLSKFAILAQVLGVEPFWLAYGIGPDGKPDDGDPLALSVIQRHKHDKLFAFAFTAGARMMAEEGLDADLAYLADYAKKLCGLAHGADDDAGARELISREIERERLELRSDLEAVRRKRL